METVEEKMDHLEKKVDRIINILEDDPRIKGQTGLVTLAINTDKSLRQMVSNFGDMKNDIEYLKKKAQDQEERLSKVEKEQTLRMRIKRFTSAIFGGMSVAAGYKFGPELKSIIGELLKIMFKF